MRTGGGNTGGEAPIYTVASRAGRIGESLGRASVQVAAPRRSSVVVRQGAV